MTVKKSDNHEEGNLVTPDQVKKRKSVVMVEAEESLPLTDREQAQAAIKSEPDQEYINFGEKVKIEFESNGRFGSPKEAYFSDYTTDNVNTIITSREEDILETVVSVLEECKDDKATGMEFSVGDYTIEEWVEILYAMKLQFDSNSILTYRWICDCQDDLIESHKKHSESEVELKDVTFISIEELENNRKTELRDTFIHNPEIFEQYLNNKYPDNEIDIISIKDNEKQLTKAVDEELKNFVIKEPIIIKDAGNEYYFRFLRVKDLINAYKTASKEYNPLIRVVQSRSYGGTDKKTFQNKKQDEIEKIQRKKGNAALSYSQAYTLVGVNGKINLSQDEKIKIWKTVPRSVMMSLIRTWDQCKCGIDHEFESVCNMCSKTEKRLLQRSISPLELLPFSDDSDGNATKSQSRKHSAVNVFFGT